MKTMNRLRFGVGFFLALSLLLIACSEEPTYDLKFNGTPTELAAHITDFRENFEIKLSDVNREIEQLEASIQADSTGQTMDSTGMEVKAPDSSRTPEASPPDETRSAGEMHDSLRIGADSTQTKSVSTKGYAKYVSAKADSMTRAEELETLDQLHSQLDRLSADLAELDAPTDSVYLSERDSLESGLNEIITQIEFIRLNSFESRPDFVDAIDARLTELDLELMDVQRRIGRIDTLVQGDYLKTLTTLRARHNDLEQALSALDSTSPETFQARRIKLTEDITALGSEVRATTNQVLSLSSGDWNVLKSNDYALFRAGVASE